MRFCLKYQWLQEFFKLWSCWFGQTSVDKFYDNSDMIKSGPKATKIIQFYQKLKRYHISKLFHFDNGGESLSRPFVIFVPRFCSSYLHHRHLLVVSLHGCWWPGAGRGWGAHSSYWSIKWYGERGRFDIDQGLAASSIEPSMVYSLPWLMVIQIPAVTAMGVGRLAMLD